MTSDKGARLSVVVITHDAAPVLERTLRSVAWADEIVVLDSGSTDGTRELAAKLGARVLLETDWRGFGRQKNRALEQATGDWILLIDADEVVDETLAAAIQEGVAAPGESLAFTIKRRSFFCGVPVHQGAWREETLPRLFLRGRGRVSEDAVHEVVLVDAPVGRLEGALLHFTSPSISERILKNDDYTSRIAEERFRAGKRASWWQLLFVMPLSLLRDVVLRGGIRDGRTGIVLAAVNAFYAFSKYAKLWELEVRTRQGRELDLVEKDVPPGLARARRRSS